MANSSQVIKNLGKSAAYSSLNVLSKLTPNISELVRGSMSGVDNMRTFVRTNQAKMTVMTNQFDMTRASRGAKKILRDAWNDIKQGNISLGDLSDDSFSDFSSLSEGSDIVSYSDQSIKEEEQKSQQRNLGSNTTSTDYRTLAGLRTLSDTLGNVTLKGVEYQTEVLTNAIMTQAAMQDQHFHTMERQLDSINKNLVQLVKFQSENQAQINAANLQFFDQVTNWMKKQEKRAEEMNRRTRQRTSNRRGDFLSSSFFNMSDYANIIKDNYSNSSLSMLSGLLSFFDPEIIKMMVSGKIQPQKYLLQGLMSAMIPRRAKSAIRQGDAQFNTMLKTMLTRLGNLQYSSSNPLLGLIGSLLGVDPRQNRTLRLRDYKRDSMSWNGEAQKALTQIIPKQLAEIKAAITKQQVQYFDSQTGTFLTKKEIRNRVQQQVRNATSSSFVNAFSEYSMDPTDIANRKFWSGMQEGIQKQVNDIINKAILGEEGLTATLSKALNTALTKGVKAQGGSATDVRRLATRLSEAAFQSRESLSDVLRQLQNGDSAFAQIADLLADERGYISFDKLNKYVGGAGVNLRRASSSGRYTASGRDVYDMTDEERRRFEANYGRSKAIRSRLSNMANSKNALARLIGRLYQSRRGFGRTGGRYAQGVTNAADSFFNKLYQMTMVGRGQWYDEFLDDEDFTPESLSTSKVKPTRKRASSSAQPRVTVPKSISEARDLARRGKNAVVGNTAFQESLQKSADSITSKIEENTKKMADATTAAFDPEKGYMSKFFNSPAIKKFIEWLKNSKVGKRAGELFQSGKDYIRSLFGEDYVDEETGERVASVKSRVGGVYQKARDAISAKFGISFDGKVNNQDPNSVVGAATKVAEDINAMGEAITGEDSSKRAPGSKAASRDTKKKQSGILSQINRYVRRYAPKALTGGIIGAGLGAATGGHLGLIGSLFLPGGPIGGAVAGLSIGLLTQFDSVKNFLFGKKDENGERDDGMISKSTREAFKKFLPTLGIGAATGIAGKLILGNIGGLPGRALSTIGYLPSMLLPGGLIGATIMGTAATLLVKQKKFQDIMFGEADENGTRSGTILSNMYNKLTGKIRSESSGGKRQPIPKRIKNALIGAGLGAVAGVGLKQLGVMGGALSFSGPIGTAIAGAALGILSASKRFQDYLYGEEDANGKRNRNGLFARMNMALKLNFIEPGKMWMRNTAEQFAWWAREKIEAPFRWALGPILDSLVSLKDSIRDTVVGTVESAGKNILTSINKHVIQPVGNAFMKWILKPMGTLAGRLIKTTLFTGASIVGAPFRLLGGLVGGKARRQGNKLFGQYLRDNRESNLQKYWDEQEEEGTPVSGISKFFDRIVYGLGSMRGVGKFFRSDDMFSGMAEDFSDSEAGVGRNHLNWLGVPSDRRRYRRNRKDAQKREKEERKVLRLRQRWANEDRYKADSAWTPEQVTKRIKAARKLGITLNNQDELRRFIYDNETWQANVNGGNVQSVNDQNTASSTEQKNIQKMTDNVASILDYLKQIAKNTNHQADNSDVIADNVQAQTDIQSGGVYDTEDIEKGTVAEEMDEEAINEIQEDQANANVSALGGLFNKIFKRKQKNEKDAAIRGNTTGEGGTVDENDQKVVDFNEDDVEAAANGEGVDSSSKSSIFGSLVSGLSRALFSSKWGIIGLLGGALAAVMSTPAGREAIASVLSTVGSAVVESAKEGFPEIRNAVSELFGADGTGGVNNQRALAFDEEGNPTDTVANTGLIEATGSFTATAARQTTSAMLKKGLSASEALATSGAVKAIEKLPGGKLATGTVKVGAKIASGTAKAAGTVTEAVKESATSDTGLVKKALNLIGDAVSKLAETKFGAKLSGFASKFKSLTDEIIEGVSKTKLGSAIIGKLSAALAKAGAVTSSNFVPFVNFVTWGVAIIDTIGGVADPERLFKVNADDVDWKMRTISGIYSALTSLTGMGGLLDVINEIVVACCGFDFMQSLAIILYKCAPGAETIDVEAAGKEFNQEVANYNEANGTNLSVDAYNDMKNKGVWGSMWDSIKGIVGKNDKTNYALYEVGNYGNNITLPSGKQVTQSQYAALQLMGSSLLKPKENKALAAGSAASLLFKNSDFAKIGFMAQLYSDAKAGKTDSLSMQFLMEQLERQKKKEAASSSTSSSDTVGNGVGSAVGFGTALQNDQRWANMPIGKYGNGKVSTMATGGCGPTALSNAANALGLGFNPPDVAVMATQAGYISNGGANAGLFTEGANSLGLTSTPVKSAIDLTNSLNAGHPVVIAGKSTGAGNNPYTPAGHIVTATGMVNGKVAVVDPMRGTQYYKPSDLTSKMTHGWSYDRKSKAEGYGILDSALSPLFTSMGNAAGASIISSMTGESYDSALSRLTSSQSDSTSSSTSSSGTSGSSTNSFTSSANGSSNTDTEATEQQIYNYLKGKGYSSYAIAGIMGCWEQESSNDPHSLECDYISGFPGYDAVMKNNQTLNEYTTGFVFPAYERSGISINKEGYKGTDGNYYPGLGLCGWTGPRAYQLLKYAQDHNMDWTKLEPQLAFFDSEMQSRGLKETMNSSTSVEDATRKFFDGFVMGKGASERLPSYITKRINSANSFYQKYATATGYGILDNVLGSTFGQMANAAGASILSSMTGTSYEDALNKLAASATSEDGGTSTDPTTGTSGSTPVQSSNTSVVSADKADLSLKAMGNTTQKALVDKLLSIYGTLKYSLDWDKQNPDIGAGSCASTVAWAYDKVMGFKPGGSGYSNSMSQSKDPDFTTIYSRTDSTNPSLSKLQLGDIVYFNDGNPSSTHISHTEMYAGNGRDLNHGQSSVLGPVFSKVSGNDAKLKKIKYIRRYTPFMTPNNQYGAAIDWTSTLTGQSVGNGPGPDYASQKKFLKAYRDAGTADFSINTVGQYTHNNKLATGYGPGTTAVSYSNNRGVETRLDTIISILRALATAKSSIGNGTGSGSTNLTVNNITETGKSEPNVMIVKQTERKLGEQDAAHEYLRSQHRKIASIAHP